MPRTGRRPGDTDTRTAILEAARRHFADAGYRGATIRAIAGGAGVDPALVHHYFGSKHELFASVLELPVPPELLLNVLTTTPVDALGATIVRTFLGVWDTPQHSERMQIIIRTAVVDEQAVRMLREFVTETLLGAVARHLGADQPMLRATLVASQLIGLAFMRFLITMEPLASADHEQLVAAYGPAVQHYLTGDLSADRTGPL